MQQITHPCQDYTANIYIPMGFYFIQNDAKVEIRSFVMNFNSYAVWWSLVMGLAQTTRILQTCTRNMYVAGVTYVIIECGVPIKRGITSSLSYYHAFYLLEREQIRRLDTLAEAI